MIPFRWIAGCKHRSWGLPLLVIEWTASDWWYSLEFMNGGFREGDSQTYQTRKCSAKSRMAWFRLGSISKTCPLRKVKPKSFEGPLHANYIHTLWHVHSSKRVSADPIRFGSSVHFCTWMLRRRRDGREWCSSTFGCGAGLFRWFLGRGTGLGDTGLSENGVPSNPLDNHDFPTQDHYLEVIHSCIYTPTFPHWCRLHAPTLASADVTVIANQGTFVRDESWGTTWLGQMTDIIVSMWSPAMSASVSTRIEIVIGNACKWNLENTTNPGHISYLELWSWSLSYRMPATPNWYVRPPAYSCQCHYFQSETWIHSDT